MTKVYSKIKVKKKKKATYSYWARTHFICVPFKMCSEYSWKCWFSFHYQWLKK